MGKHGKPAITTRYLTEARPDHPLAMADGRVRVHRAVLYDSIGPENPECHWCQRPLVWDEADVVDGVNNRVAADHLDGDTWNNDPENLVPACWRCNYIREGHPRFLTHCRKGHEYTPENTYWRPDGLGRMCRVCSREREARRPPRKRR